MKVVIIGGEGNGGVGTIVLDGPVLGNFVVPAQLINSEGITLFGLDGFTGNGIHKPAFDAGVPSVLVIQFEPAAGSDGQQNRKNIYYLFHNTC